MKYADLIFNYLLYPCFYEMIHRLVAKVLDVMFSKGDAIAIDMQMTVTAVIIYLAITLSGHVVVSIADSFAAKEITTRLRISNAKAQVFCFCFVLFCFFLFLFFHSLIEIGIFEN